MSAKLTSRPSTPREIEVGGFVWFGLDLRRDIVHLFSLSFDVSLEQARFLAGTRCDG